MSFNNYSTPLPYSWRKKKRKKADHPTKEQRQAMIEDRKKGMYLKDIAKKHNSSQSTVHNIVKDV